MVSQARQSLGKPSADLLYDDGDDGDDDDSGSPFGFGAFTLVAVTGTRYLEFAWNRDLVLLVSRRS